MDDIQQQRREEQTKRFKVELGKTESEIRLAYKLTATGQEFANALEDRGFILTSHRRRYCHRESPHWRERKVAGTSGR